MADTPAQRGLHLVKRGKRMTGVAADAALATGADKRLGPRELRRDRGRGHAIGVSKIIPVFLRNGRAHRSCGVAAACFTGKVRAVKMGAEYSGALRAFPLKPAAEIKKSQVLLVTRDGSGRQKTGGAVTGMGPANRLKGGLRAVHEVGPGAAVDVQVDVAGDKIAACQINGLHRRVGKSGR